MSHLELLIVLEIVQVMRELKAKGLKAEGLKAEELKGKCKSHA